MATANVNAKNFSPELWDAAIYRTLEDNLVAKKICNMKPNRELQKFGDVIYFNGLADPTVTDYAGSISYETLTDSQIALHINQQKYYAFDVTDLEGVMANVDLKGSQADRAAYMLKDAVDTYLLSSAIYADAAGGTVTDSTCDSATILSDIAMAAQLLDEHNVPSNDRFLVIPPWIMYKLKLAGISFSINEGINGKGGMQWAKDLGFDVYVSNNVANLATAAAPQSQCLAGSYQAIGFAEKLMKSETLRNETAFSDHVRGLIVFGARVIKPKELVLLNLTYAAETAI